MIENLLDSIKQAGMDYETFRKLFAAQIEKPDLNNEQEKKYFENRKLNWHRTQRLEKTFNPSAELINAVTKIDEPQIWAVITESWCGDSAQVLPIIVKAASLNNNITLQIITRDDNPEIMDRYLTNGSRSIPKLIVFDEDGMEFFQWGPRPKDAAILMKELKEKNISGAELYEKLHLWYSKDRGRTFERELTELISNSIKKSIRI